MAAGKLENLQAAKSIGTKELLECHLLVVEFDNGVIFTRATPPSVNPILRAAAGDKSRLRLRVRGPRSFTLTSTERPFRRLVTRTIEPIGSVLEAAVRRLGSNRSPLEVRLPS
jgi:hypothetical protein